MHGQYLVLKRRRMSEKCPLCLNLTLAYVARDNMAICHMVWPPCGFREPVADYHDYMKKFMLSKLNWDNYCMGTPRFVRLIRGHMRPLRSAKFSRKARLKSFIRLKREEKRLEYLLKQELSPSH